MDGIQEIDFEEYKDEVISVVRESFLTVANEFKLTKENAPTNPAFITYESMLNSIKKGLILYGIFVNDKIVGCIGIEDAQKDGIFYIERLAVLPEYRHNNYGGKLLEYSFCEIINRKGKRADIAIVDENKILKNWYSKYGFIETGIKKIQHLPFTVCFMKKELV